MKYFVRIIDDNGLFVEDTFVESLTDKDGNPISTYIETPCPNGFYLPRWDGTQWIEGKTAEEIAAIQATAPADAKATALVAIEKATTIASLRNAMLGYIEVSGVN